MKKWKAWTGVLLFWLWVYAGWLTEWEVVAYTLLVLIILLISSVVFIVVDTLTDA